MKPRALLFLKVAVYLYAPSSYPSVIEVTASGFRMPLKLGFDRVTGLPRAVRTMGTEGESVDTLSDFKAVDGILFPFVVEDRVGAHQAVTTISIICVNAGVVAADFARRR